MDNLKSGLSQFIDDLWEVTFCLMDEHLETNNFHEDRALYKKYFDDGGPVKALSTRLKNLPKEDKKEAGSHYQVCLVMMEGFFEGYPDMWPKEEISKWEEWYRPRAEHRHIEFMKTPAYAEFKRYISELEQKRTIDKQDQGD